VWAAIGTTAVVRVADGSALGEARRILEAELAAIDLAASRFRDDSELARVNRGGGAFTPVSPLLHEAIAVALAAAELSDGRVDPTLGREIADAGYDRDFAALELPAADGLDRPANGAPHARDADGWRRVWLCADPAGVRLAPKVVLDLGATAKALTADRAAAAIHAATGTGVLVSLGGDIATAGAAPGGAWTIHVTDDHRAGASAPGQTVAIAGGGLATSSTAVRRWQHRGRSMHHILDPATGLPAGGPWRTVSVAAATCVEANIASTAAIVLGERAGRWLAERELPARLVAHDGCVTTVGAWPSPDEAST
jgi:thiamine biosynthesis lipoprotein